MAGKDDSEEKTLPPSEKKLKDVRKKGQVAKSQDMVTAMTMIGCTICIVAIAADTIDRIREMFDLASRLYIEPFDTLWPRLVAAGVDVLARAVLPLIAVTITAAILTNIVVIGGVIFAGEPLAPKGEKISPAAGFKRIFSVRSIVEFVKSLVKMLWLLVSLLVVYWASLPALMGSSLCGLDCVQGTFVAMMKPLLITALLIFLLVGGIDVLLQRWLFRRDQRMSKTDQKRENKDIHGDPQVNSARRNQRQEISQTGSRTGVKNASIMIGAPGEWVVGVCYLAGETPVPLMTCRSKPNDANKLLTEAAKRKIPLVRDPDLARLIAEGSANGSPVPDSTFQPVANILAAAGLI